MTQGVHILTDNHKSFKKLLEVIEDHIAIQCFDKAASSELMPWVNIAISNAKRWILGIHHNVKPEYFQNYLNEFCYKFNRRYFDHMLMGKSSNSSNYYQVECIGLQTDSHRTLNQGQYLKFWSFHSLLRYCTFWHRPIGGCLRQE